MLVSAMNTARMPLLLPTALKRKPEQGRGGGGNSAVANGPGETPRRQPAPTQEHVVTGSAVAAPAAARAVHAPTGRIRGKPTTAYDKICIRRTKYFPVARGVDCWINPGVQSEHQTAHDPLRRWNRMK